MKSHLVVASLIFLVGVGVGYGLRGLRSPAPVPEGEPGTTPPGVEREPRARPERSRRRPPDDESQRYHPRDMPSREDALRQLGNTLQSDEPERRHEALHHLLHSGDEPLSRSELDSLARWLAGAEDDRVEELAHLLAEIGGPEGVALVLEFLRDPDLSPELRHRALHGLARVSPERAGDVIPALQEFIEGGPGRSLQHEAAHALGRLLGDDAGEVLLGWLEEKPGVRSDVIFDALGATGGPEDATTLLALLSSDRPEEDRWSLVRAIGRISSRHQDGELLLTLMRDPPPGASKEMLAEAIANSGHHLGTGYLEEAFLEVSGDPDAQEPMARALIENGGLRTLLEVAERSDYQMDERILAHALTHDARNPQALEVMRDLVQRSRDEDVLEPLARSLFQNGGRESRDQLLTLLESGSGAQRRAVAHGLEGASRDGLDLERLTTALRRESDEHVTSELANSIGRLFGDEGLREVASVLESTRDVEQRHALMGGLERSSRRTPYGKNLFVQLAGRDPSPGIRVHAVEILDHFHDASLLPALEELRGRESHPEVQARLQEAIDRLRDR